MQISLAWPDRFFPFPTQMQKEKSGLATRDYTKDANSFWPVY